MPFFDGRRGCSLCEDRRGMQAVYTAAQARLSCEAHASSTAIARLRVKDIRIGFIGLGNVGGKLAGNLLRHGAATDGA